MEKRLIIAAALSVALLLAWGFLFPPPAPPRPLEEPPTAAGDAAPRATAESPEDQVPPPAGDEPFESDPVAAGEVESILVETDRFLVELTNRGARARAWRLVDYTRADGEPLPLFPDFVEEDAPLPLEIVLDDAGLDELLDGAVYRVRREDLPREGALGPGERIVFEWADGRGLEARKSFEFRRDSYLVGVGVEVRDRGRRLPARLALGPGFSAKPAAATGWTSYYYHGQVLWNDGASVTRVKPGDIEGPGTGRRPVLWAGLEDQYFAALVLPAEPARLSWDTVALIPVVPADAEQGQEVVEAAPQPIVSVEVPEQGASLFVGPKRYTLLREYGRELDEAVWFSSYPALAWVSRQIFLGLLWLHDHTIHNYGFAIILATVILRLLLFPVNQYSMVSMKKAQLEMQRLQPQIKAIKSRYKKAKDAESRAKMNQEMMDLYRKEGVNPMGGVSGCLPLLAQFPILIGFYNMLTVAVELRGAPFFGWIQDLSRPDPWMVTPLLMGATMFWQQKMAMSKIKDPVQQQQQRFMLIMPVVFTYICIQMPSGMVLYWFVNNVLGIGQQWLVNRQTSRLEAAAQKA